MLSFYLHLRASEKYAARPELLRSHPILRRLLTLKQSLVTLEDLDFALSDADDDDDDDDDEYFESEDGDEVEQFSNFRHRFDLRDLEALIMEAQSDPTAKRNARRNKKARSDQKVEEPTQSTPTPTLYDVEEPTSAKTPSKLPRANISSDAFGEASVLDTADAADKNSRRKALRFHTAKIESASARRQGARMSTGGDDDIPYRQRKKELIDKVNRKNLGAGGDDLDDEEPEAPSTTRKRARQEMGDGSDSDNTEGGDYYSLVKNQKKARKAAVQEQYEASKERIQSVLTLCADLLFTMLQIRRWRRYRGPAISQPRHSREQRSHCETTKKRSQPARQEEAAVRKGQEEACFSEGHLQRRRHWQIRWRKIGHFQSHQKCQAVNQPSWRFCTPRALYRHCLYLICEVISVHLGRLD